MNAPVAVWLRVALAIVGGIFLWFFIGETISPEDTHQMIGVAAYGFAVTSLLPWPS